MKIKNVQLEEQENFILLTAECTLRKFGADTVYFKFDKKYKDFIAVDASPFAAALLIPAMKLGQDLHIEGEISEQLYQGMQKIMKIVLTWDLGLKPISITVDTLTKKDTHNTATRKASFFSGGVDSFYTYLKNKEGGKKMDYLIMANGYDISVKNRKLWKMARESVENATKNEGVDIIEVESNIRILIDPIMDWSYTFGGCLAALGLCLRKELKDVFIASAYSYDQLKPDGAHPDIDHLWSTESLSFHHDGAETGRLEKTMFISKYPEVLKNLRVCFRNKKSQFNCGSCDKCMRTMISLYIANVLERSETFPRTIDVEQVKKLKINQEHAAVFQKENLVELERLNMDSRLQNALREALRNASSYHSYTRELAMKVWFLDYFYDRSRLYMSVDFFRRKLYSRN